MNRFNNHQNLKFILVIVCAFMFFAACKRSNNKNLVTGCKDPKALNYNSKADVSAPCSYAISGYAGRYYMADTEIYYKRDYTHCWYDTIYSHYYINCSVVCNDSMYFDTLIRCPYCASKNIVVSSDNGYFSFNNGGTSVDYGGSGYFQNDTLYFQYGTTTSYGYTGSYRHRAVGKRQ